MTDVLKAERSYPPGTCRFHFIHINAVISTSPKCVKLDVSCHTLYLDLPCAKRRIVCVRHQHLSKIFAWQ